MSITAIKSKTAAIYARISADPTGESTSVETQIEQCQELADRLGLTVVDVYQDVAVSAFSGDTRPAFERLLQDVAVGRLDTILIWHPDRLYRRNADYARVAEAVGRTVEVRTVTAGSVDLSTASGSLNAGMLALMAEYESAHKAERVRARAQARAVKERRLVSSMRPFGWRWRKPCGPGPDCRHAKKCTVAGQRAEMGTRAGLEPDPVEAPALAQAYTDVSEGLTLYAAHKRLADRVDIGKMTPTSLGALLRNARHAGLVTYQGEIVGEAKDGQRIVERALFDKVLAILSRPERRTSPGRPANTWLGGGVLVCGICGGPMSASTRHSRGTGTTSTKANVYICSRNRHLTRRRANVDSLVLPVIADVLAELAKHGKLTQTPAEDARAVELQQQIDQYAQRLDEMAGLAATGVMNPVDYANAANIIRADVQTLKRELATRSNRPALNALSDETDLRAVWDGLLATEDTQRVRSILKDLTENITANDDRSVTINWRAYVGLEPTVLVPPRATVGGRDARRKRIAELHAQGLSILAISNETGNDRATIRNDLKALGLYGETRPTK